MELKRNERVVLINAVYGHGSTGTIVRDIENICFNTGINCYVASPDSKVKEAKNGYLIGNFFDHKVHAVLSRIHGKQAYFSYLSTWRLIKWIKKIKPDVVHLHNLHSNYVQLNMLLKFLAKDNLNTVITLHDCWFYTGGCFHYAAVGCNKWLNDCKSCPKKKFDTPAYFGKKTDAILADRKKYLLSIPNLYITGVSEWMAHEPQRSFLNKTPNYVIQNGVDLNVFKPSTSDIRQRLELDGKYVILGPANKWLLPINKNVLLSFITMMKDDEVLLLFGCSQDDCSYINELQVAKYKLIPYGFTSSRSELAALYSMADVFVNTTHEDSFSLINIEAQACGTPVVTFDQTGPKETVDNVNSFHVPVGEVEMLYDAVEKVRNNSSIESSKACRHFVEENYNIEKKYQLYIDLYRTIIYSNL